MDVDFYWLCPFSTIKDKYVNSVHFLSEALGKMKTYSLFLPQSLRAADNNN